MQKDEILLNDTVSTENGSRSQRSVTACDSGKSSLDTQNIFFFFSRKSTAIVGFLLIGIRKQMLKSCFKKKKKKSPYKAQVWIGKEAHDKVLGNIVPCSLCRSA